MDKVSFVEFDMTMTIEPRAYGSINSDEIIQYCRLVNGQSVGRFESRVSEHPIIRIDAIERPIALAEVFQPKYLGRVHVEIGRDIRLASPRVFGAPADIVCQETDVRLETSSGVFSRWIHWYADWEPVTFRELNPNVCSLVTVSKSSIVEIRRLVATQLKRWTRVRRTVRPSRYGKYEVKSEAFSS